MNAKKYTLLFPENQEPSLNDMILVGAIPYTERASLFLANRKFESIIFLSYPKRKPNNVYVFETKKEEPYFFLVSTTLEKKASGAEKGGNLF